MLAFKVTEAFVIQPGHEGEGQKMDVLIYPSSPATDVYNVSYFSRLMGFEKKLYEYKQTASARKPNNNAKTYLEQRVEQIRSKYTEVSVFGLKLMMQMLYLNQIGVIEKLPDGSNGSHGNGTHKTTPLKATYVTIEDAFYETKKATQGWLETLKFITELHFPITVSASIAETEAVDFELQAERALGISMKKSKK